MHASEVKQLLEDKMDGAIIAVDGEGCDFRLTVVSDVFGGVLPVKRQQMVYTHLNDLIAAGTIHAVTMQTFTYSEWSARQG